MIMLLKCPNLRCLVFNMNLRAFFPHKAIYNEKESLKLRLK
jgi:hypothetical protein